MTSTIATTTTLLRKNDNAADVENVKHLAELATPAPNKPVITFTSSKVENKSNTVTPATLSIFERFWDTKRKDSKSANILLATKLDDLNGDNGASISLHLNFQLNMDFCLDPLISHHIKTLPMS